ncbi:hypothetical protein CK203_104349 [Vitis vinifera]|uniref:MSP domain-containing protein n=1 Tax=Vitis vinifera TaxID=29760 RepID=A0A438CDH2_VITVI|nr:hypothetical protein CK203_104349 [Vitis vinifera]
MHTMSVAVSLTTTNPSLFSFPQPFSILPPLSSSPFTLLLSQPSDHPPLSSPNDTLLVRTAMLPTGKAHLDDLRRLFSKPGPHVFKDAAIPIFLLTSLLRSAVVAGNADLVEALIDAGGDVNSKDSDGRSMMGLAIRGVDLMEVLCKGYAEIGVNSADSDGRSPLHVAAAHGHVEVLRFCLSAGGTSDAVDCMGDSASLCCADGHGEAAEFLLEAQWYMKEQQGWMIVHGDEELPCRRGYCNGRDQNGWIHYIELLSRLKQGMSRLGLGRGREWLVIRSQSYCITDSEKME